MIIQKKVEAVFSLNKNRIVKFGTSLPYHSKVLHGILDGPSFCSSRHFYQLKIKLSVCFTGLYSRLITFYSQESKRFMLSYEN